MQKDSVYKKAVVGTASLGVAGIASKLVTLGGAILLARWLTPQVFGVFAIVGFLVGIIKLLNDVGLSVSLIQRDEELEQEEISSIFFFQLGVVFCLAMTLFLVTPLIPKVYPAFESEYRFLVYALIFELFIEVVKSVPKALMARDIKYKQVAKVEFVENLVYWAVVLICAYQGLGVWALALAVIIRTCCGTLLFYMISSWRPSLCFNFLKVKGHLKFGIEYQLARIADFARTSISPTVISSYFGVNALGLVTWSSQTSQTPFFIVNVLDRVGFSLYARLQNNLPELKKSVVKSVEYSAMVIFPLMSGLIIFSEELIHYVFTPKWIEANSLVKIFSIQFAITAFAYPLYTCIFSLGHMRYLLFQGIVFFFAELAMTFMLMNSYGVESIALAQLITGSISVFAMVFFIWKCHGILINVFWVFGKAVFFNVFIFLIVLRMKLPMVEISLGVFIFEIILFGLVHLLVLKLFYAKSIAQVVRLVRRS